MCQCFCLFPSSVASLLVQAFSGTVNKIAISAALRGELMKAIVFTCSCKHPQIRKTSFEPIQIRNTYKDNFSVYFEKSERHG